MERIGIYVIYDQQKIIDPYIGQALSALKKHLSKLIIVCNFHEISTGYEYISSQADEVHFRENIGFDAGAYKDELLRMAEDGGLDNFDELLIANDSFYGPIYPFGKLFSKMGEEPCDFWGVTRYPGGTYEGIPLETHVQSYCMVFKGRVIHSEEFYMFWKNLDYPLSFVEAVFQFEIKLNSYLSEKGYIGKAYTDTVTPAYTIKYGENPYMKYPLQLIQQMEIPMIKRKAFDFENNGFPNALQALDYIDQNTEYDVAFIKNHLIRTSTYATSSPAYDLQKLEEFYHKFGKIYIYGAGGWGTNVAAYFNWKGWKFAGFLVSKSADKDLAQEFDSAEISPTDGIIIAVGKKKIIYEIYENVLKKCDKDHIFMPHFKQ